MQTEVWRLGYESSVLLCAGDGPAFYISVSEAQFGRPRFCATRADVDDALASMPTLYDHEVDEGETVEIEWETGEVASFRLLEMGAHFVKVSSTLPPNWNAHSDGSD